MRADGQTRRAARAFLQIDLHDPVGGLLGRSQALCIITNDDWVSVSVNDVTVLEGDAGRSDAEFQVTLSGPSQQPITVNYGTGSPNEAAAWVAHAIIEELLEEDDA